MNDNSRTDNTEYAGFWVRVGASFIDTVWQVILLSVIGSAILGDAQLDTLLEAARSGGSLVDALSTILVNDLPTILLQNLLPALLIIPFWIYFGATPGKMLLGLKIVDASDGGKIKLGQSIVRFLAYIPAFLILCMGFFMIAFDKRKQGLHDKLAGTVVIKTR